MAVTEWIPLRDVAVQPRAGRKFGLDCGTTPDHTVFRAAVARWRAAFSSRSGDRWGLYFDHALDFAPALFGAWHAGKTVYLCADKLPASVDRLAAEVDGFAGDLPAGCPRPVLDLPTGGEPDAFADAGDEWEPLDEQATRLVVFTSGSTGDAQAMEKRLEQLARELEAIQHVFGQLTDGVSVIGTVSHQHIYGLLFRVLWPLCAGMAIGPRMFFHEEVVAALVRPTLLISSPAHLRRIPAELDWKGVRRHLRGVFSSGGALPVGAAEQAREFLGHAPIEIFGSSETGGIAWRECSRGDAPWQPLPRVQWRIVGEHLELASPHLAQRGWWRSEDRAVPDGKGGFRLLGRADRIVKVEERRVSLTALERALSALPDLTDARVLLLDGARSELAAVVVPSEQGRRQLALTGRRRFGQRLSRALSASHDAVARPRRWRFVTDMPVNAQGKTTEMALRELFRPKHPTPEWGRRSPAEASLELVIEPGLAVFDGHFPGQPILPGVAQLDWAIRFAREVFDMPRHVLRVGPLKFQQVIRPGTRVSLQLDWNVEQCVLGFRYESSRGVCASGRVLFAGDTA